jgi:hypothetical protein
MESLDVVTQVGKEMLFDRASIHGGRAGQHLAAGIRQDGVGAAPVVRGALPP